MILNIFPVILISFILFSSDVFAKKEHGKKHSKEENQHKSSLLSGESDFLVARVNNKVITFADISERYNFILLESKIKIANRDEKILLLNQIIDKMIDEELIRQEGQKLNIIVNDAEINNIIESVFAKKKGGISAFKKSFIDRGLSFDSYRNQIKTDLIWSQIISNAVKSRIKITDTRIKEFLEQEKINIGVTKFLIAEIFLQNDKDSKILATKLVGELRAGADFVTIVKQFSRSSTQENGGEIGWVSKSDVDQKIFNAISKIERNSYSDPVFLSEGYYIFKVLDKKFVTEVSDNSAMEARKKIFSRELEVESKSYLLDLHKNSFIEIERSKLSNSI